MGLARFRLASTRAELVWLKWMLDGVLILAVVSAMTLVALNVSAFYKVNGIKSDYYQSYYEPAVRIACGQPFGEEHRPIPVEGTEDGIPERLLENHLPVEMQDFLATERDSLSCENVPEYNRFDPHPVGLIWYYLLLFVGTVWRFTGISWAVADSIPAIFVGLSCGLYYLLFRSLVARTLAVPLAILSTLPAIPFMPYLRDAAKFPFVVGAFAIVAFLFARAVQGKISISTLIAAAAVAGVTVGIGYGFRPDIIILVPVVLVALVIAGFAGNNIAVRTLAAVLSFMVAMMVSVWPALGVSSNLSSCTSHFALLGLSESFTSEMGITHKPYHLSLFFSDAYVADMISTRHFLTTGEYMYQYCTNGYNESGMRILFDTIYNFPFDMLERGYQSALHVLTSGIDFQLNLTSWRHQPIFAGFGTSTSDPQGFDSISARVAHGFIFVAWAAALVLILVRSRWMFLAVLGSLVYVAFYPAVQFHIRHYYYLSFLTFLPLAIIVFSVTNRASGGTAGVAFASGRDGSWNWQKSAGWLRYVAPLLPVAAAAVLVVFGLYVWQERREKDLFGAYWDAPVAQATLSFADGAATIPWPDGATELSGRKDQILRVDLGGAECPSGAHAIMTTHRAPSDERAKETTWEQVGSEGFSMFRPILYRDGAMVHIDMKDTPRSCIGSIGWLDQSALPHLRFYAELAPPHGEPRRTLP